MLPHWCHKNGCHQWILKESDFWIVKMFSIRLTNLIYSFERNLVSFMAPRVQPQDFTYSLFGVVQVSAVIIASLGALIGFEKVFFPFS